MSQQDESDAKRYQPGELLSYDNIGPEGYVQSFIWRDTSTKRMFSHSDKEASEDVYLEGLEIIRLYYKRRAIKIRVIKSWEGTRVLRQLRHRETIKHTLPTLAELSQEGHQDDDPQHIGGSSARINTHASRLAEQSTQALDQSSQWPTTIDQPTSTHPVLSRRLTELELQVKPDRLSTVLQFVPSLLLAR